MMNEEGNKMKKVTKTEMKASLKTLKALQEKAEALALAAKQAEEEYEAARLETMRKVQINKLARSTQLIFNGRIINVKPNGSNWFDITENGVKTRVAHFATNIHQLRVELATGQL
jgi:ABC-type transporter lipoprotein component MlaA